MTLGPKSVLAIAAALALLYTTTDVFNGSTHTVAAANASPGVQNPGLYPALQRPTGDPALIERGQTLYDINCRACHGMDLRGGDLGGPNLLRSQLVLRDATGDAIWSVIRDGQSSAGGQHNASTAVEPRRRTCSRRIHPQHSRHRLTPGEAVALDILVGDPSAGQLYFEATCASCHSVSGELQGIATRIADPQELQNTWVRGGAQRSHRPPIMVTVTQASGQRVEGTLERLTDFIVVLTTPDGQHRSFGRQGSVPQVDIDNPLARHLELLPLYNDDDIHNVTAYLATLK
jgi:cytochrome c oxidase cbb3-type subunit 3